MKITDRKKLRVDCGELVDGSGLKFRSASNGFWLCALLPCALLSHAKYFADYSELYKIVSIAGVGTLVCSACDILRYRWRPMDGRISNLAIAYLCSSTITSLLLIAFTNRGPAFALCVATTSSVCFSPLLERVVKCCPGCFTYGEANLVSQSLMLFVISFGVNVKFLFGKSADDCGVVSSFVLQTVFFAVSIVVAVSYKFTERMGGLVPFLLTLVSSLFIFVVAFPFFTIKVNTLFWLLRLIWNRESVGLISFWIACCFVAVGCLMVKVKESKTASSASRKSFHLLMFFVVMPGLAKQPCLLSVSCGIAFALLVVTETIRKLNASGYARILQSCYETFKDAKDEYIAMTPLYLMVGCAAPLWIYPFPFSKFVPLPVLSGVLTVAIGDAAASVCGTYFGRRNWPGSLKTVEGTAGCFLAQTFILVLLNSLETVRITNFLWPLFVVAVTSAVEAYTDQVDNLILPFVSYILFSINT